ncbi:tetratricopeptide repeat protein [Nitrospira sp. NS4]|uniref:tetratricopeptide repeat protein n=1 Tax=Nitrospira sp. NS4 TaxID=3414498 RepID=UPI003C30B4B0
MASGSHAGNAAEIDRLALALAKDPGSKAFIPLAEEYGKAGMWAEAAGVLEDGLKYYPAFITAMVALGRAYDQLGQPTKAKAILEEAVKISPENLRAHRTLAKIYVAEGAKEAALRSCNVILVANPSDQESLSLRASLGLSEKPGKKSTLAGPVQAQAEKAEADIPASLAPREFSEDSVEAADTQTQPVLHAAEISHADLTTPADTGVASVAFSDNQSDPIVPAESDCLADQVFQGDGPVTPKATLATANASQSVRRRATVQKLEQWLRTIQARRLDRPSTGQTALIS